MRPPQQIADQDLGGRLSLVLLLARTHGYAALREARCFGRQQKVLELDHYLDVLSKKPGALAGSSALEQCRAQGRWPASFDRLWEELKKRRGRQNGMLLLLGQPFGSAFWKSQGQPPLADYRGSAGVEGYFAPLQPLSMRILGGWRAVWPFFPNVFATALVWPYGVMCAS